MLWYSCLFQGLGAGSNDFKAAMDKVDQEYYAEIMNSADSAETSKRKRETVSVKDDGTTLDDIEVSNTILRSSLKNYLFAETLSAHLQSPLPKSFLSLFFLYLYQLKIFFRFS